MNKRFFIFENNLFGHFGYMNLIVITLGIMDASLYWIKCEVTTVKNELESLSLRQSIAENSPIDKNNAVLKFDNIIDTNTVLVGSIRRLELEIDRMLTNINLESLQDMVKQQQVTFNDSMNGSFNEIRDLMKSNKENVENCVYKMEQMESKMKKVSWLMIKKDDIN